MLRGLAGIKLQDGQPRPDQETGGRHVPADRRRVGPASDHARDDARDQADQRGQRRTQGGGLEHGKARVAHARQSTSRAKRSPGHTGDVSGASVTNRAWTITQGQVRRAGGRQIRRAGTRSGCSCAGSLRGFRQPDRAWFAPSHPRRGEPDPSPSRHPSRAGVSGHRYRGQPSLPGVADPPSQDAQSTPPCRGSGVGISPPRRRVDLTDQRGQVAAVSRQRFDPDADAREPVLDPGDCEFAPEGV